MTDPIAIAKRALQAYADSDRDAIAAVIGNPFTFTSPLDNGLDRATYFERCWPNNERTTGFDVIHASADGDRAWITYEGVTADKRFRNVEIYTVRDGQIVEVEVYFGWNVPHPAPQATSRRR